MKVIKGLIILILTAVVVFFLSFNFIYRIDGSAFFKEGIKQVYVNRGINKHDYTLIGKGMAESGREDLWKDVDLGRKALKDVYLFSFDMIDNTLDSEVMVVDTGMAYLGLKPKLTDYFDRRDDFYVLKDERKPRELMGADVYLKTYRGYFVAALSPDLIDRFLEAPKAKGGKLKEMDGRSKEGSFGKVLMDLEGDLFFDAIGVDGGVTGIDLKRDKITISNELFGRGEFIDSLKKQPEERRYKEFAGENRIYISGSNIGGTLSAALKNMNPRELDPLNMIFGMLGVTIEDVFDQIDEEVVMDVETNSWIIPLKDTRTMRKIFGFFGQKDRMLYGDSELVLDGKVLRAGEMKETGEEVSMEKNTFIYGDIPMNMVSRTFGERSRGKLSGRVNDRVILLELELNEEATKDIVNEAVR